MTRLISNPIWSCDGPLPGPPAGNTNASSAPTTSAVTSAGSQPCACTRATASIAIAGACWGSFVTAKSTMLPVNLGLALISCAIVLVSVCVLPDLIAAMIWAETMVGKLVCAIWEHCGQACRADAAGNAVYEGGPAASADGAIPTPANARLMIVKKPIRDFIRASLESQKKLPH